MIRFDEIIPEQNRVTVILQGPCNYRCHYCHVDGKRLERAGFGPFATREGAQRLVAMLDIMGRSSVSLVGGGEAMLLPNFVELCRGITRRHKIGITTNFSAPVEPFMEAVPQEAVSSFVISLHPEGEKDLGGFRKRALAMQEAGYPVTVIYVAHPLRMDKIPKLYRLFAPQGIVFKVAPFFGTCEGRRYPSSYTGEETAALLPFIVDPVSRFSLTGRSRRHRGKPCAAGYSSFAIFEEDGRIQRCQNSPHRHGNVFDATFAPLSRPAPCTTDSCHCDFTIEEQLFLKNYYRRFDRRNLPAVSDETMKEYERACRGAIRPIR